MTSAPHDRRPKFYRRSKFWLVLFWVVLVTYGGIQVVRNAQKAQKLPAALGAPVTEHVEVSDFQAFYRSGERMALGETVYFAHRADDPELPNKHAPPFPLMMRPFLLVDIVTARVIWDVLSVALIALCILLGQRIARDALGVAVHPWTARISFLLVWPFFHKVMRAGQAGVIVLAALLLGIYLLRRRPLLAGLALSVAVTIKMIPIVLFGWLLWRRSFRAAVGILLGVVLACGAVFVDQGWERGAGLYQEWVGALRDDRALEADSTYTQRFRSLAPVVACTVMPEYRYDRPGKGDPLRWNGVRNFLASEDLADHSGLLIAIASALMALGCAWACWPRRRDRDGPLRQLGEFGMVLLAMLLICPQTWTHYLLWLYPAVLLLAGLWAINRPLWAINRPRPAWVKLTLGAYVAFILLARRNVVPASVLEFLRVFQAIPLTMMGIWAVLAIAIARGWLDQEPANGSAS